METDIDLSVKFVRDKQNLDRINKLVSDYEKSMNNYETPEYKLEKVTRQPKKTVKKEVPLKEKLKQIGAVITICAFVGAAIYGVSAISKKQDENIQKYMGLYDEYVSICQQYDYPITEDGFNSFLDSKRHTLEKEMEEMSRVELNEENWTNFLNYANANDISITQDNYEKWCKGEPITNEESSIGYMEEIKNPNTGRGM